VPHAASLGGRPVFLALLLVPPTGRKGREGKNNDTQARAIEKTRRENARGGSDGHPLTAAIFFLKSALSGGQGAKTNTVGRKIERDAYS
jgi:hypothetical protein